MSAVSNLRDNPKRAFYIFDVIFALAMIIVMTFGNFILDPTHTDWGKWGADTTILVAIQLAMIVIGTNASKDRAMNLENGLYQRALHDYNETFKTIKEKNLLPTFSQFYFWYRTKENFENRVTALMTMEFDGLEAVYIVNYVKTEDLETLKHKAIKKFGKDGNEIIIQKIGEERIEDVRDVLNGVYDVKQSSYAYYLSVMSDGKAPRSILDQGAYFEEKARKSRSMGTMVKVGTFLVFSALLSMITIYESEGGAGNPGLWFSLGTRLASMVGGATSGWLGGIKEIKFQSATIMIKATVLHDYMICYETKQFVPKTYEELAKEQYAKQLEEEEKAKANTITPEVVEEKQDSTKPILITSIGGN